MAIKDIFDKYIKDQLEQLNKFTEQEFEKCIIEAIKCRDFMQHTYNGLTETRIGFTYIPYREMNKLKDRINKLEQVLDWYSNGFGHEKMEIDYDIYINDEDNQ